MRTAVPVGLIASLVLAMAACSAPKSPNEARTESSTTSTTSVVVEPSFDERVTRAPTASPAPQDPTLKPGGDRLGATSEARTPLYREPREGLQDQVKQPDAKVELLDDGQVLGVLAAANASEIDLATIAKQKASKKDVKEFAGLMFTQHTDAQAKGRSVGTKTKIASVESDASKHVKDEGVSAVSSLRDRTGADFDRAYMDAMVRGHRDVLSAIDQKLLPNVKNGELKGYVGEMRQHVVMHLAKAEDIQRGLGGQVRNDDAKAPMAMTLEPRY